MYFIFPSSTNFLSSPIYDSKSTQNGQIKTTHPPTNCPKSKRDKKSLVGGTTTTTHSVLNGNCGVNTVLIIEINVLHPKTLEASLTTGPNILRGTIHYNITRSRLAYDNPKLRGNL